MQVKAYPSIVRGKIALHDHVGGEDDGDAGRSMLMLIRVRILTNLEYDLIRDLFHFSSAIVSLYP